MALLVLPVVGLLVLLADSDLDVEWQHQPSHFWLVLAAAAINAVLAWTTGSAASRRRDVRVYLVSLAFLAAAGFLALHALATPRVLLDTKNAGFTLASPVGLLVAAGFAAASSAEPAASAVDASMARARWLKGALLAFMAVWAALSLAELPPFDDPSAPERASGPLVVLAVVGIALYGVAVIRYAALYRRRGAPLILGIAAAFVLLAEAMFAIAVARDWHASWWEWHVLMLLAFGLIAWSAQRQWHEERFSDLYAEDTVAGTREVSVLFADLAGFTTFSERHDPREVSAMLNDYFQQAIPPIVQRHGGQIDRLIGDALMAVFDDRPRQPDHAVRAARAALDIHQTTEAIAASHDGWPRFRVGINTGEALIGVLGAAGGRTYTVIGDTVNLASRLETAAPVGGVVVGPETARRLDPSQTRSLGLLTVKGKEQPVEAYRLVDVDRDTV